MTEFKFPDPQPIDWDALEAGDEAWIKATAVKEGGDSIKFVSTDGYLLAHYQSQISGHVIKAPRSLAVGDKVRIVARPGHWVVLAFDDDMAWLRHTENPTRFRRESVQLAHLVRVEP